MEVRNIKVGYLNTNCYIVVHNNNCLVIDPGDELDNIVNQIGKYNLLAILVTHNHPDHIGALKELIDKYNVPVYGHSNLKEGKMEIGDFNFEVIYTPGHTSDSVSYYFPDYNFMFTGDFIFKDTIGRTDLPTGDMGQMKISLNKIRNYNQRIKIYPGHGDNTDLGYEVRNNIYFNL